MATNKVIFTLEQLELIKKAFPTPVVKPGVSLDTVMYAAGQQDVVAFISRMTMKPGAAYE